MNNDPPSSIPKRRMFTNLRISDLELKKREEEKASRSIVNRSVSANTQPTTVRPRATQASRDISSELMTARHSASYGRSLGNSIPDNVPRRASGTSSATVSPGMDSPGRRLSFQSPPIITRVTRSDVIVPPLSLSGDEESTTVRIKPLNLNLGRTSANELNTPKATTERHRGSRSTTSRALHAVPSDEASPRHIRVTSRAPHTATDEVPVSPRHMRTGSAIPHKSSSPLLSPKSRDRSETPNRVVVPRHNERVPHKHQRKQAYFNSLIRFKPSQATVASELETPYWQDFFAELNNATLKHEELSSIISRAMSLGIVGDSTHRTTTPGPSPKALLNLMRDRMQKLVEELTGDLETVRQLCQTDSLIDHILAMEYILQDLEERAIAAREEVKNKIKTLEEVIRKKADAKKGKAELEEAEKIISALEKKHVKAKHRTLPPLSDLVLELHTKERVEKTASDSNRTNAMSHLNLENRNALHELKMRQRKRQVEQQAKMTKTEEVKDLITEKETENSKECIVCMDAERAVANIPCGHIVCCENCGKHCKDCPVCRSPITQTLKVYFS